MNQNREWLNSDKTLKTDDELKEICQSWNAETWEQYLQEYSYAQSEVLQSTDYIDRTALESFASFISEDQNKSKYPTLKNLFLLATKNLSSKEQKVLRLIYQENLQVSDVAKEWNQKGESIRSYKMRALSKIKKVLIGNIQVSEEVRSWFEGRKYLES